MTKKHFQLLAKAMRFSKQSCDSLESDAMWRLIADNIATVCKQVNPRFDKSKFLEACGLDEHN
jgi:hypothetical protein